MISHPCTMMNRRSCTRAHTQTEEGRGRGSLREPLADTAGRTRARTVLVNHPHCESVLLILPARGCQNLFSGFTSSPEIRQSTASPVCSRQPSLELPVDCFHPWMNAESLRNGWGLRPRVLTSALYKSSLIFVFVRFNAQHFILSSIIVLCISC